MTNLMIDAEKDIRDRIADAVKEAHAAGVEVTVPDVPLVGRCEYTQGCEHDGELMLNEIAVHIEGEESWTYICDCCAEEMYVEL